MAAEAILHTVLGSVDGCDGPWKGSGREERKEGEKRICMWREGEAK